MVLEFPMILYGRIEVVFYFQLYSGETDNSDDWNMRTLKDNKVVLFNQNILLK